MNEKQTEVKTYDKAAALLMPTKNGRGYKIVVNGTWYYTSTKELADVLANAKKACNFRTVEQIQTRPTTQQVVAPTGVTELKQLIRTANTAQEKKVTQ